MDNEELNYTNRIGEKYQSRPSIGGFVQDTADRLPPPQKPQNKPPRQTK